jgi:hypothetical protein
VSEAYQRTPSGGLVLTAPDTPLRPDQTDALLQHINNALEVSTDAVAEATRKVAECQKSFKKAETRLLMSPDCPRVGRTVGTVTAAERDAWVARSTATEWEALHDAEVLLNVATSYAWKIKDQISLFQSLNNNAQSGQNINHRGGGR